MRSHLGHGKATKPTDPAPSSQELYIESHSIKFSFPSASLLETPFQHIFDIIYLQHGCHCYRIRTYCNPWPPRLCSQSERYPERCCCQLEARTSSRLFTNPQGLRREYVNFNTAPDRFKSIPYTYFHSFMAFLLFPLLIFHSQDKET